MGLIRRMLLAALAEVGKEKREAVPVARTLSDTWLRLALPSYLNGEGCDHCPAPARYKSVYLHRRVCEAHANAAGACGVPTEPDVTTAEGRRALFDSEFQKAQEKLRTRN
jgi:hypothetical protein